jgi:hypothetical protein
MDYLLDIHWIKEAQQVHLHLEINNHYLKNKILQYKKFKFGL